MAINKDWRQIAGLSFQDDGSMGLVWMSIDTEWDVVRVHHAVTFKREVLAIIAGELNRKPWVPVAWENEEFALSLLDGYKCNMLPDRSLDTRLEAERLTNEIWERMRSGRFKIGPSLEEWIEEQKRFNRRDSKIPRETHPLMAATRHAIAQLQYSRTEQSLRGKKRDMYPKVAIA